MTTEEKLAIVAKSKELKDCMGILYAAFIDCELKSHLRYIYEIEGTKYEIIFLPLTHNFTIKGK